MKNSIDFLKIDGGKLGAINFNNMMPVKSKYYKLIDVNKKVKNKEEKKYQELLKSQLSWLNANHIEIRNKALKLYNLYINNRVSNNIKNRCCNYILLEEKCNLYKNKVRVTV